ncbi:MAG: DUF721 domain-containing protein [Parachlamydiales bacterium]|nr:DUF721 domain-containing protein [Parachlamydiales bacterium]
MQKYGKKNILNKKISDMLPEFFSDIEKKYTKQPDKILEYWPKVIGKKLSPLTKAVSFQNNVLYVLVKSSTLYSILVQTEKDKLLKHMQKKFGMDSIRQIVFKSG